MIARRGPKYPKKGKNLRPKAKNRKTKTRRTERNRATTTSDPHGPWWQPQSDRGGAHGRGGRLLPWLPVSFACLFDFRRFLLCFVFIFAMYLNIQNHRIHSIANIFSTRVSLEFLERERKKGEDCKDPGAGLAVERREHVLDELSFSFSSLFSSLFYVFVGLI